MPSHPRPSHRAEPPTPTRSPHVRRRGSSRRWSDRVAADRLGALFLGAVAVLALAAVSVPTAHARSCFNRQIGYGGCAVSGGTCVPGSWSFSGVAGSGPTFCERGTYVPLAFDGGGSGIVEFKCMEIECTASCGDGTCDADLGESTASCSADCRPGDTQVVGYGNCRGNRYRSVVLDRYGCGTAAESCGTEACPYTWQLLGAASPTESGDPCSAGASLTRTESFGNGDLAEFECQSTIPIDCGDGTCSASETASSCHEDCGACGDTICGGTETPSSCPADCGPECGDGVCEAGESSASCAADCGSDCGDGTCDAGESSASCPSDCGAACGDGICDASESAATCYDDCGSCGDGICSGPETAESCATDCSCDPDDAGCEVDDGRGGDGTGGGGMGGDGAGGDGSGGDGSGSGGSGGDGSGGDGRTGAGDGGVPSNRAPGAGLQTGGCACTVGATSTSDASGPLLLTALLGIALALRRRARG